MAPAAAAAPAGASLTRRSPFPTWGQPVSPTPRSVSRPCRRTGEGTGASMIRRTALICSRSPAAGLPKKIDGSVRVGSLALAGADGASAPHGDRVRGDEEGGRRSTDPVCRKRIDGPGAARLRRLRVDRAAAVRGPQGPITALRLTGPPRPGGARPARAGDVVAVDLDGGRRRRRSCSRMMVGGPGRHGRILGSRSQSQRVSPSAAPNASARSQASLISAWRAAISSGVADVPPSMAHHASSPSGPAG